MNANRRFARPRRLAAVLVALLGLAMLASAPGAQDDTTGVPAGPAGRVVLTDLADVIGPISANYTVEAIEEAAAAGASLVIVRMDTPGGLDTAMRTIVQSILASPVPICVYVAPEGARAASAGAFITLAAHVAAMAPGTNIGAASPVNMGGGGMDTTMASKVFNDSEAYIRSLARMRDRNEEWAAAAVREAESIHADEALERNVIDVIATGPRDLLSRIDGMTVSVHGDSARTLQVRDAEIVERTLNLRWRILSLLNNPTVAYLLLMLGFYGLFFELSNPGAIFPGVAGAIALILGLIGLQTLSLNYAGLLLIILSVILFFLEIKVPSAGLLTIGGVVSLVAGSLMLFDSPSPLLRVSLKVIIPTVAVTAAFFLFAVTMAARAQRRKVVSGAEGLVGLRGRVRRELAPGGTIFVAGEHWSAECVEGGPVPLDAEVEVIAVDHLKLKVRPVPGNGPAAGGKP